MQKKYDLVFLTNLSSFYKINLYNEIAKKKNIYVIFISKFSNNRSNDFFVGEKFFEYTYLNLDIYENRNSIKNSKKLRKILVGLEYEKIVLGGWDSLENWTAWLLSSKQQNALVVESSEFESTIKGIKGLLKKYFLRKISLSFASGNSQINLLRSLGYEEKIVKTKGVGIFNYEKIVEKKKKLENITKFLYVGRLSNEKNIEQLIRIFNEKPNLQLNIVGYGPLENNLKSIALENINFLGEIKNKNLSKVYQDNHVFILPSKYEPWGLVVEEALFNGLPVLLSDKVGCSTEIIENTKHGYVFPVDSKIEILTKIEQIIEIENYNFIKENIKKIDFKKIKKEQVEAYFLEKNEKQQ